MPYPKRRSCTKCVQAKRKCNLGLPRCQRCEERSLVCFYGTEDMTSAKTGSSIEETILNESPTPSARVSTATLPRPPITSNGDHLFIDVPSLPGFDLSMDWTAEMRDPATVVFEDLMDCPVINPSSEKEPFRRKDYELYKPRVAYAISRAKRWAALFAETGSTPFIHPSMFHIGGTKNAWSENMMLDALSACALYSLKTSKNHGVVVQDIRRKARVLVERRGQGKWEGPEELLTALQVLHLYQSIRLFDGDIALRAEGENDEPVRVEWTKELTKHLRPLHHGNTIGNQLARIETTLSKRIEWRDWVFDESVRRVLLASHLIQGSYSFIRDKKGFQCGIVDEISITAQKALWEAPSEYHWNATLGRKIPYEISLLNWDHDTTGISIDDADDIGVITMVMLKGLDHTAQWLGEENLEQYGMDWESMRQYLP